MTISRKNEGEKAFVYHEGNDTGLNWGVFDVVDVASKSIIRTIMVRRGSVFDDRPKLASIEDEDY